MRCTDLCDDFADTFEKIFLNILKNRIEKGRADTFKPLFNPLLEMEELAFACEDTKCHRKSIVIPVCQRNQTFTYILSDVQHSTQV